MDLVIGRANEFIMLTNRLKLHGKTAFVTGSSQGIGKAIALELAEQGANIIIQYRSDKSEAQAVAREIRKKKVDVYIVQADFSKSRVPAHTHRKIFEMVKSVDILVINASVQMPGDWMQVTEKDFDLQVSANFKSTFRLMQLFAENMIEQGWGRILTVGSVQQVKPHPSMVVYAATKSAVLNLVQNVAMQLADQNITVNNLAPGVVDTPRIDEPIPAADQDITKRMETPAERLGKPEDCAYMAALLCSDAGAFITGQNIFVDGGMSL